MPSRHKRPSLKGKGADIFFSGEVPIATEPEIAERLTTARGPEVKPKSTDESLLASMQASAPARQQPSKLASKQADPRGSTSTAAGAALDRIAAPGRITASFRFAEEELEALDDAVTEAKKKHRVRIAKQEVVRLGLAALLSDYEARGTASVLGQYIAKEREKKR